MFATSESMFGCGKPTCVQLGMLPDSNFRSRVPSARANVIAGSSRFR